MNASNPVTRSIREGSGVRKEAMDLLLILRSFVELFLVEVSGLGGTDRGERRGGGGFNSRDLRAPL